MKLNVIVPTYNRAASLKKTLLSLAKAERVPGFEVVVTVVNNNSTDETAQAVEEMRPHFTDKKLEYLFEPKQGRSNAVNCGITHADGDLITMIDDDIRVTANWFIEIEKIFRRRWNEIDFAGGKILPEWECENEIPGWIEPLKNGVICWRDYGDEEWRYTRDTPMLTGGHAVFKASVFKEIGLYSEELGVKGKNLLSCEDDIMFDKLLEAGKTGVYFPQLVVYHYVPKYRVSKNYYRQWCFGAGASWYLMDVYYKPFDGAKIFGVPRWMYKNAFLNLLNRTKAALFGTEEDALKHEKSILVFAGFFHARNLKGGWLDKLLLQSIVRRTVKTAER
jgi:glycosyltransferase involved in cell wall biosynthesis